MTKENLIKEAAKAIRDLDAEFDFNNRDNPHDRYDALIQGFARAALAVFEKALGEATITPTDDEREAVVLRAIRAADDADEYGDPVIEAWSDGERFTSADLRALAAGFRRSEVPEPISVKCPDCGGDGATYQQVRVGQHATPFVCARCDGDGEVSEPSTDHMDALSRIDQAVAYVRASWLGMGEPTPNTPAGEIIAILRGVRTFTPEPQGEPSDARVETALRDWYGFVPERTDRAWSRMRATLRVAVAPRSVSEGQVDAALREYFGGGVRRNRDAMRAALRAAGEVR